MIVALTEYPDEDVDVLELDLEEEREDLVDDGGLVELVEDLGDAGEDGEDDLDVAAVALVDLARLGQDLGADDVVVEIVQHDRDDAHRGHLQRNVNTGF